MICSEEYLDGVLARESIALSGFDAEKLKVLGFKPRTVTDGTTAVTDLMLRCPCDQKHRWRFYIAAVDNGDGTGLLYGFRDGLMSRCGFEYREFNDLRRMSKYNAGQDVDDWMVAILRTMIEQDAVTIEEGSA